MHSRWTIAVDGRSGSGKTTLATELATDLGLRGLEVLVVHLDDLYPGWQGLDAGVDRLVDGVLEPFRAGAGVVRLPGWDWVRGVDTPVRELRVPDGDVVLITEGVGAGARRAAALSDLLIWLDASAAERKRRALGRDGAAFVPHWAEWAAQEREHLRREDTRARAHLRWSTQPRAVR